MIGISNENIEDFIDFLLKTEPFKSSMVSSNRQGFKNILVKLLKDLYLDIPNDVINYMDSNASAKFLDLLYREAGINDYYISKIPETLKMRLSYLLNLLNTNRASQKIFNLFHEALEEFFPKMNIYQIEINPKELGVDNEMTYSLEPRYISDPDSILTEVSSNDLSGTFLMRPEQFIDTEEKFSNVFTDYKSKQRTINIFPIKTGIIYVQNPSGIGQSHFDEYIPLMQMIGATLQKDLLIPWKMEKDEKRSLIIFEDFIKICTYLKFKEFEFKQPKNYTANPIKKIKVKNPITNIDEFIEIITPETFSWKTEPLEIYRNQNSLIEWEQAQILAKEDGLTWSSYFTPIQQKLNDMLLDPIDLIEAERLELVYRGLKRSGLYNGRTELNQFKTDWNTLRQSPKNTSIRKITTMNEFRDELIGVEPISVLDFELILLKYFTSSLVGDARNGLFKILDLYQTNKLNTLDPTNGLYTLTNKFHPSVELNNFIIGKYGRLDNIEKDEIKFLLDLKDWYTENGFVPILRNYYKIKSIKFPHLMDLDYTEDYLNNEFVYDKLYKELMNDDNKNDFKELNNIIKVRYKKIITKIDSLKDTATEETFVMIFLNLWKIVMADTIPDKRVQYFWNDFFMRYIMGSSFKDFFYDPIMDLFLEYWFPAETSVQNKDIVAIRIRDKMNSIPLKSTWNFDWTKKTFDTHLAKDQFKITVYKSDGNIKESFDETFKTIAPREIEVHAILNNN